METQLKMNGEHGEYGYHDEVKVRCLGCGTVHNNKMYFDLTDSKYPDDFFIQCKNNSCSNTEEGSLPMQHFELLEMLRRVDAEGEYNLSK